MDGLGAVSLPYISVLSEFFVDFFLIVDIIS